MFRRSFFMVFLLLSLCVTETVRAERYISPRSHSFEEQVWGAATLTELSAESSFKTGGPALIRELPAEAKPVAALPLWLEYAMPVPDTEEDAPMIAIVIDDLGLSRSATQAVLSLPPPITTSFLAYADDLQRQADAAREKGHELLLHAPMEPNNPEMDPGTNALRSDMSEEEISQKLSTMLSSFTGYVGLNNHMGSMFTANAKAMSVVIGELKKRGLLFLDSLTAADSVAWKTARDQYVPYAVRNVFLDNSLNEADIMAQLSLLEKQALKHRAVVGIGHPHKITVKTLKKWIPAARQKGFVFVPVSTIALVRQDNF